MTDVTEVRDKLSHPDGLSNLMRAWRREMPSDMQSLLDRLEGLGRDGKPLTRAEAKRLREHLQRQSGIAALLSLPDQESPRIAELKTYARWLHVFESDWPQDESGTPDPIVTTDDGRLIPQLMAEVEAMRDASASMSESKDSGPAAPTPPNKDAARKDLEQLPFAQPELWAAYHDSTHPGHQGAVDAVTTLHQRAAGDPVANQVENPVTETSKGP